MSTKPYRVLFYVQHLLGIGHLMRARRVAIALSQYGFDVSLVTGGANTDCIDLTLVSHIALPSIAVKGGDFSQMLDQQGQVIDESFKSSRRDTLLNVFENYQPHVVFIEAFPFGRRQVEFELLPLLEHIEKQPSKPLVCCSLRDIVQRRNKPGRDQQTADRINRYFDALFVHGDEQFFPLQNSFSCADQISHKTYYTGLVCDSTEGSASKTADFVVSAGGGAVGEQLIDCALLTAHRLSSSYSWLIVTGPNLTDQTAQKMLNNKLANVRFEEFLIDFPACIQQAELSISQAGYNTVADILMAECRSILVPYSASGETEQTDRALKLQQLGLATVIKEKELNESALTAAIETVIKNDKPQAHGKLNLNGALQTASQLEQLLTHTP